MRNRIRVTVLSLLLAAFCTSEAHAVWIWTPQSRRWVNPKYAAKDTPRAQMDWAVNFFEARDYRRAVKEFVRLVQAYPRSELAPEAQYLAGVCYELLDKPSKAFEAYKKVVEIYPFSRQFKDSVEREFAIAESFSGGKRIHLIGPVSLPSLDQAVEIYQHVVTNAPYSDYGAKSQFMLGECYSKQGRYEEASRAYQRVTDEYPSSPLVEQAKFRVAFCARQLSLKPSYDQSATDEAINWYESFIASHPDSDLLPQARESLRQLKGFKATGFFQTAAFYEKQGKPASAAVYYQQVVDKYPDSPEAVRAAAKLVEFDRAGVVKH